MRNSVSPGFGRTASRLLVAALLAGAASGCSSDASRFGGLFSSSGTDNLTTSSIPRRTLLGGDPVPRGDVGNGTQFASAGGMESRDAALNQPFPGNGVVSHDPINTSTTNGSGTRFATTPMNVQRGTLSDPTAEREVALGQTLPDRRRTETSDTDRITTSTVNSGKAGWSTRNAPVVMLRQGESVKTLSDRYGVPEKEILAANGLKRAGDAEPGQRIVIPTFSTTDSVAKATTDSTIKVDGKLPTPERRSEEKVAILPGSSSRDKSKPENGQNLSNVANAGEGQGGSVYEVKPGDSLAKIARNNGVTVDALRRANGLDNAAIRIGQKLTIPEGGAPATAVASAAEKTTDKTVTASVPDKKRTEAKPESYTPPVKTVSLAEVEQKSDVTDAAPESTGIGKYRWPVRGAVVSAYGSNINGSRNDGIDISVPEGTPIKAAENGVVIYSGSSLKELGNAVLVRHDDGTVTVYGHAGELNVQRGQKVQRGQTVATSGMSGNATRPKVHFEVRKNATPVNPMTYLE